MPFIYDKKESYSQADIDNLLEQHKGFVSKGYKDFVSKEDYDKVIEELKPFKTQARKEKIKTLLPDNANTEMFDDILSIASIDKEDNDDIIAEKLSKTIESRSWYQKEKETIIPPEIKTKTKIKKKEEPKTKYRFLKNK